MSLRSTLLAASAAALLAGPAVADSTVQKGDWITLSGTIGTVSGKTFTLDFGADDITVELDGYGWYNTEELSSGDKVKVTGRLDSDFTDRKTIEARSVYVEETGKYHFANPDDEEGTATATFETSEGGNFDWVAVTGVVADIGERSIKLDAGEQVFTVETVGLPDNPFDDEGDMKLGEGEYVVVYGRMEESDLFSGREIEAFTVAAWVPES